MSEYQQAAFATSVIRNDTLADTSDRNTGLFDYTGSGFLSHRTTAHHLRHCVDTNVGSDRSEIGSTPHGESRDARSNGLRRSTLAPRPP
jgi:hypothetical protein